MDYLVNQIFEIIKLISFIFLLTGVSLKISVCFLSTDGWS